MAYPNSTKQFVYKIDKNASGYLVGPEYFNVPSVSPYTIYLDHVPKSSATTVIGASGGATWTEVFVTPTAHSQYLVNYDNGAITFNSANASAAVQAVYRNLGDDIMAEHVNSLQDEVTSIENNLGSNPQGAYSTVRARFDATDITIAASGFSGTRITDNTVRAGALMSDIKGSSWDILGKPTLQSINEHISNTTDAHDASSISCEPAGSGTYDTVQEHINSVGLALPTDVNPHGLSLSDLGEGDINISSNISANIINGNVINGSIVSASGNAMYINYDGPDGDAYLYYYGDSKVNGKFIRFNDGDDKFEINEETIIHGDVTASGNFMPEASGTRAVGSQSIPWASGNFNIVTAGEADITNGYFSSMVLDTIDVDAVVNNLTPSSSGVYDIGSMSTPWASGNFNAIQSVAYMTGDSAGTNGQFLSQDGKNIIVKNGLVVSIL